MGGYLAHSPVADIIRSGRKDDVTTTASAQFQYCL